MTYDSSHFSVEQIPFSYSGSWFNLSPVIGKVRRADDVHLVSHRGGMHAVLRFVPLRSGRRIETELIGAPASLRWTAANDGIEAAYEQVDVLRIRGRGLGLAILAAESELTPFSGVYFYRDAQTANSFVFTSYETGHRYRVTQLDGEAAVALGAQDLGHAVRGLELDESREWEIAIEEFRTSREPYVLKMSFDDAVRSAASTFHEFAAAATQNTGSDAVASDNAAYLLWSTTVAAQGFLTRTSILMSKHWMDKVWSWDHCFNAIALADSHPELAWDQFLSVFDHQDERGALPDSIAHSEVLYNFVKPPIHGWALSQLRSRLKTPLNSEQIATAYARLSAWTMFWLTDRRAPGHALPHYQHGNDSGWDNATSFAEERLVETADLACFLILQLETLAGLAVESGRADEAPTWVAHGEALSVALLDELWDGHRFASRSVETGKQWTSESLLDLMPIVLGDRLPPEVSAELAKHLAEHLVPAGLATEKTTSSLYEPDGYWRGPAWAPSTVLIEDGLRRGGHVELADEISRRFRAVCEQSGFAENFNALTGEGLRDRAYTWTASAYLILAAQHAGRRDAGELPIELFGTAWSVPQGN